MLIRVMHNSVYKYNCLYSVVPDCLSSLVRLKLDKRHEKGPSIFRRYVTRYSIVIHYVLRYT
jgi:hypothetical protein